MDIDHPNDYSQAWTIANMFSDVNELDDEDDEDTKNWKSHVPAHLHEYGDVFSKRKSEWMPARKAYNHAIDFVKGAQLPKPAKLYALSPSEKNSLDQLIDK